MATVMNITLEQMLDAYREHFGFNYPLCIGMDNGTDEEIMDKIRECIYTDTPAPEPVYEDGCDY